VRRLALQSARVEHGAAAQAERREPRRRRADEEKNRGASREDRRRAGVAASFNARAPLRGARAAPSRPTTSGLRLVVVPAALVALVAIADLVEAFLEEIGGEGHPEQVIRRTLVPAVTCLREGGFPLVRAEYAATDPRQRDELHLLIRIEILDRVAHLRDDGIVGEIREDLLGPVVVRVVRKRHAFLGLKLPQPVDDEPNRVGVHFEQHRSPPHRLARSVPAHHVACAKARRQAIVMGRSARVSTGYYGPRGPAWPGPEPAK